MSSTISGADFPALAQLLADLGRVQQNFNTLTAQASSGLIANTWAGLGGTASMALSLGPEIDNLQVAQNNIDAANGPAQVTQTAMTQIQSIASNLLAQLPTLAGLNSSTVDTVAANARSALAQLADLLDSQYAGTYVFAGQDSTNPPVPDPDQFTTSGFFSQISAAVAGLTVNGAAVTVATTLSIASSNVAGTSPFSTWLSQPAANLSPPSVSTGNGQSQTLGLLASANTSVASAGSSTTGSYMRDLMRALATIGSLNSTQANDPNFAALVSDTQTSLTEAITAMSTDVGILGEQQSSLAAMKTTLGDTATALTGQLSNARDVDMATTLSNLNLVQTQLQASYQLIATASTLTLARFLPAA
jgi:flagellin-like hook-associated protein FlgL